jgi:hypothetical protein
MFSFIAKPYKKQDGSLTNIILVTGDDVDSTYPYKDQMKSFGAKWIEKYHTWGWWGSPDKNKLQTIIETMVKPAISFLLSKEQKPDNTRIRTVENILDEILKILSTEDTEGEIQAAGNVFLSPSQIKDKIQEFKEKLVNTVNGDEFKQLMMPIINARRAQGYQYSLGNTILIWVQDPKAKLVKSKKKWAAFNREVKPKAPAIALYVPVGGKKAFNGKDARQQATEKWLKENGFKSIDELTLGEKEKLNAYLDKTVGPVAFKLAFSFYDQRFTQPMAGKEDLLGDTDTSKIAWFNDSGNETEAVKEKIYALLKVVAESGVDVSNTKNLGGALGVSKGGKIEVLQDALLNSNFLMTLSHEFAHELLHQTYLKDKNNGKDWGQFYVGRENGRGYIEQQAELTAWIVCNFYGYDIKEAINYAALWGMDSKNAVKAFDSVAKAADAIINGINEKIKQERGMNESKEYLTEVNYTGQDIARMVGAEDLYLNGLKEFEAEEQAEAGMYESTVKNFKSLVNRINETDKRRANTLFD